MKKMLLLFCVIALAIDGNAMVIADNPTNTQPPIDIPIQGNESETSTPWPLSLIADIEASYYNGALTVVFNADLGNADIVVSNLTTGDTWSDSVTGVGSATLLLSGDEGYYEILIYTDGGDYSGEFTL